MAGAQVHYLSAFPTSLAEVLLTGGIPPNIDEPCSAESAYTRLFRWARPALDIEHDMVTDIGRTCAGLLHARRWGTSIAYYQVALALPKASRMRKD